MLHRRSVLGGFLAAFSLLGLAGMHAACLEAFPHCDLLVMAEDARIGYMPTRVWGCPTTAMWTYRLGPTRAKQLMFTGDTIDGTTAAAWGLANEAVPADQLEAATMRLASRIAGVPRGHLAMHKMVVNQVMLNMGLEQTQMLATIFDGISRHNPEGLWFRRYAQENGFKAAVQWRDSGRPIPEGDEARALIVELEARQRPREELLGPRQPVRPEGARAADHVLPQPALRLVDAKRRPRADGRAIPCGIDPRLVEAVPGFVEHAEESDGERRLVLLRGDPDVLATHVRHERVDRLVDPPGRVVEAHRARDLERERALVGELSALADAEPLQVIAEIEKARAQLLIEATAQLR